METKADAPDRHAIPMTAAEVVEALVALDVARWGEAERDASRRRYVGLSYGRLLNALARRPEYDFGDAAPHLVAAAQLALTARDRAEIRASGD